MSTYNAAVVCLVPELLSPHPQQSVRTYTNKDMKNKFIDRISLGAALVKHIATIIIELSIECTVFGNCHMTLVVYYVHCL